MKQTVLGLEGGKCGSPVQSITNMRIMHKIVAVFSFVSIEISCHLSSTIMLW